MRPLNSTIFSNFNQPLKPVENRILICTDLDRTLLPNGIQPESAHARIIFARLTARPEVVLAYVSGRHRGLVQDAIWEYKLPSPDWVIGDVGTTIYQVNNDEWMPWMDWEQDISTDWQGLRAMDLVTMFDDIIPLRLQEDAKQNTYKLSYYLSLSEDKGKIQEEMAARLKLRGIKASLIYSVDETERTGLLDVLPERATKLHAVEFLMRGQGFGTYNTIFAGDSGNDLPVLISPISSILVANATDEVVELAKSMATQQGTLPALYMAHGGFMGMNGNYSAGILEGIAHYFPSIKLWLE
ncbi:hypothetical protein MCAMS1_01928 [biofilm metagenome]